MNSILLATQHPLIGQTGMWQPSLFPNKTFVVMTCSRLLALLKRTATLNVDPGSTHALMKKRKAT